MKRTLLFLLLTLLPFGGWAQRAERDTAQRPERGRRMESTTSGARLALSHAEYDFGTVDRRGGDLCYELTFSNEGTTPLVLTRVITSCTCLKSEFSKRPIPAGGVGKIRLTYQPLKAEPGAFHKVVQILSNSSAGRELFTIRGKSIDYKQKNE